MACVDGSCAVRPRTREQKRNEFEHDPANARDIWQGLRDDIIRLGHGYFDYSEDVAELDEKLHDVWDELIHAAKVIPPDSSEHDRLVTLVLEAHELGPFARRKKDAGEASDGFEAAVMPNGQRLWTDLPHLAQEFQDAWANESMGFSAAQRAGVAVLTAKLCAAGACATDLASCALWLFKEALETERPVTASSSGGDASLTGLLPACVEWFKYGNFKLAKLCADNHASALAGQPGHLAAEAGVTQQGFSVARWLFWRRRLGELCLGGTDNVAQPARACFETMVSTGLAVGVHIPGEKRYLEKVFEALEKELVARGSGGCVSAHEIEVDPKWAEEEV